MEEGKKKKNKGEKRWEDRGSATTISRRKGKRKKKKKKGREKKKTEGNKKTKEKEEENKRKWRDERGSAMVVKLPWQWVVDGGVREARRRRGKKS